MTNLKIPPEKAIYLLSGKAGEISTMIADGHRLEYYDFIGWCSKTWSMIDEIYWGDDMHPDDIRVIGVPTCSCSSSIEAQRMLLEEYYSRLLDYIDEIQGSMKTPE